MMMIVLSINRLCIRWVVTSLTRVKAPTSLTHTVLGSSGAHPNQMKQVKMILKAQEVHFELHNSAHHRYEVDMTNDGHTSSTGAQGTLLWVCHLGACCSSYQLLICVVLSCGVESAPPELSESSLLASFDSNKHLNGTFYGGCPH